MNNTSPIVNQIESKIDEIAQDRAIASGLLGQKERDALDDYVQIQKDNKINTGLRYIALDVIAQKHQLYHSPAERQKITDVIGQSLTDSSLQQTFDDTQLLKSDYGQIYQADQNAFDRVEKLLRTKLGLPPMTNISSQPKSVETVIQQATTVSPAPAIALPPSESANNSKLGVIILTAIAATVVGAWAFSMGKNSGSNTDQVAKESPQPSNSTFPSSTPNPPTAIDNSSSISREAAINTVKQWLEYKRILLAPPYNKQLGTDILVGKAYRNNIDKSSEPCSGDPDDCLSSVDWLQKYNAQYSFGVQRIDSVDNFVVSGNTGTILVTITEYRTLHKTGGRTTSSGGTKQSRYDLQFDNGKVKISDYKVMN